MKHVIVNLTLAEAKAMMTVLDHTMASPSRIPTNVGCDPVRLRAAYRAANKLQDAIRTRVTAEGRPTA